MEHSAFVGKGLTFCISPLMYEAFLELSIPRAHASTSWTAFVQTNAQIVVFLD